MVNGDLMGTHLDFMVIFNGFIPVNSYVAAMVSAPPLQPSGRQIRVIGFDVAHGLGVFGRLDVGPLFFEC